MEHLAYIGLGSNLGDRRQTLLAALDMLRRRPDVVVEQVSEFIQTQPLGPAGQGEYLNAAAALRTCLGPMELLDVLQDIERKLGRRRDSEQRWGPRTCDLDILMMDELVMDDPRLTIPHPRMHERLFVLRVLAQIAPKAVHPVLKLSVEDLLRQAMERL